MPSSSQHLRNIDIESAMDWWMDFVNAFLAKKGYEWPYRVWDERLIPAEQALVHRDLDDMQNMGMSPEDAVDRIQTKWEIQADGGLRDKTSSIPTRVYKRCPCCGSALPDARQTRRVGQGNPTDGSDAGEVPPVDQGAGE